MITVITNALLLTALALLFYAWACYPVLLALLVRHRRDVDTRCAAADASLPRIVVLCAAFNEAPVIAGRIANLMRVDYPRDRLTVLIGTDGCTDDTVPRATQAAAGVDGIRLHAFPVNRGKVAVLRDLVAEAARDPRTTGALLVFTDANTRLQPGALRMLARRFHHPDVGGVCGRLVFTGGGEENAYWDLETRMKRCESLLDSCLGANGAIYAVRAELFWRDIPVTTLIDDFVIGMKVREAGFRMLYAPEAVAEEDLPARRDEWCRRVRIGSGAYQAVRLCKACLHPRFGLFAWCFWSHKILRWYTPHLMLFTVAVAVPVSVATVCAGHPLTHAALLAHAVSAGILLAGLAAVAGRLGRRRPRCGRLLRLCGLIDHFITMQAALFVGFSRFCRGNLSGAWIRTPRGSA